MNVTNVVDGIKKSVMTRILMIGFLTLVLLIPFAMIYSLINEREVRRNVVIREINSKWALAQTVSGPILEIPYNVYEKTSILVEGGEKRNVVKEIKKTACFLPDQLIITGNIVPETRYRGIYKTTVYTADLVIKGQFVFPDFEDLKIPRGDIIWDEAMLFFGITDMRGINKNIRLEWNRTMLTPRPGIRNKSVLSNGISASVMMDAAAKENYTFSMTLNLRGSETLYLVPLGRKTVAQLSSDWRSPSFCGAFLPKSRVINEKGFEAQWEIFAYNREFPQQWTKYNWNIHNSNFGVDLYEPVDEYQKTTRSIKYAILFIALTFVAFFVFFELFNNKRIHSIQYLLVGFALCIFYLLLISLSEHLSFDTAYFISSLCIIVLTTVYIKSLSRKWYLTALMGGIITGLYSFLYIMLRLEDYALLMGSLGLFTILAAIMLGTRKVDWYSFKIEKS